MIEPDDRRVVTAPMSFTVLGFASKILNRVYKPGTRDTWQPGDQFEVIEGPDAEDRVTVERGLAFGWVDRAELLACSTSIPPV